MKIYEIVVKATVSETYRIIADNDQDAMQRAGLIFQNNVMAEVVKVQFDVHRSIDGLGMD